jgi:hypothetical protein
MDELVRAKYLDHLCTHCSVGFISIVLQIFFNLVGTAGLARGVVQAENGAVDIQFGELFSESLGYFWRLFGAALDHLAALCFCVFSCLSCDVDPCHERQ